MKSKIVVSLCASLIGAAAQAGPFFSDNFDANSIGLNTVPSGWTVTDGTVDIIGNGSFDFYPGNGAYIDLDGSTGNAGILSRQFSLDAGVDYIATLVLGGSTRGDLNEVTVNFGASSFVQSFASNAALTSYSISFTPSSAGAYTLSLANAGGDNLGAILTSVNIVTAPIPEPSALALTLAGLGLLGAVSRKRLVR